jgi:hypothetical protein
VIGRAGDDNLFVKKGEDVVRAGGGDDRVNAVPDGQRDVLDCGPGNDWVIYEFRRDNRMDVRIDCERVTVSEGS